MTRRLGATAALLALMASSGFAQTASTDPATDEPAAASQAEDVATTDATPATEGTCTDAAATAEPATAPVPSPDGTVAGNSGWTGGTGGSLIGTNPQGAVSRSKTWHAPTARGLDLKGVPEPTQASLDAGASPVAPDC
ncbi:hypothetical protein MLD63_13310 [Paracoccus sp. TK19116]|uniref:Uncharacterized protein n=1 Tax=Paracoccus albicereus TaxID=2922394 RepID=A0ABT1MSV4_9RHOB|nr:hypothetical protein [Paracoccus albicereus]MCQ0971400.1 hypothetical protein [Paracoccus albicereus]